MMKRKDRWSNLKKADFLTRIGSLLEQGYTISESIHLFLKYENKKEKVILKEILYELEFGHSFSDALVKLQIPKNIISFVYFAEHYGNLAQGLKDGGELLRKTEMNKKALQKIVKYPLFLLWILIIFLIVMYQYLFPQFQLLFANMNMQLPLITRVFLLIVNFSPFGLLILFFTLLLLLLYFLFHFQKRDELYKVTTISKIPVVGRAYRMVMTYFFAMNLSCLIKSGMSIYESLEVFKNHDRMGYFRLEANRAITMLERGETLDRTLLENPVFLGELAYVVDHGQSNGRLDIELFHYSQWLLDQIEAKMKKLLVIIQPTLFFFIGIFILLMFAAILIPIFSLINGL